jgi:nicotinamidase-related amidase
MPAGGLNSSKLALLVIDMQNEFAPMAKPILAEVNATIASARQAGIPVIFSQHGHPDPENEEKISVLVKWWGASGSIRKGSEAWKLLSDLDVAPNEVILDEKITYDAFYRTRLKSLLDEHNVDTVIISGVLTQLCCETTARSAFVQNYDVIFLSDGTGPPCKGTLDTIAFGFGKVITCSEMRARFDEIKTENSK